MPRPVLVACALLGLVLAAGCIGGLDEEAGRATAGDLGDPISADDVQVAVDPRPGPADRRQATATLEAPAGVEGLTVDYTATLEGPGELRAQLESPEGTTIELVDRRQSSGSSEATDTLLVPAEPGEWTLAVDASAPATLEVTLTANRTTPSLDPVDPAGETRSVVAVVDTGVNPYHDVFQRPDLSTRDLPARIQPADGAEPLSVPVDPAPGYAASLRSDAPAWTDVLAQRLVHFEGTNLLGYHLDDDDETLPTVPVLDQAGHGTGVAHSVVRENPDVLVVLITGDDYDEGVAWAAEQPWIDLVSLSWGPVVNAAGLAEPYAAGFETPEVTRQAHANGKLVFTATGNDPTPAVTDTTSGPPWVHAVSGAQPDTRGRAFLSGNLIDTVANWTQPLADHEARNGTSSGSGTSFATPTTAGIASEVLDRVRESAGHDAGIEDGALVDAGGVTVTNADLREALNRSAVYWDTTEYGGPTEPGPSVPVAPTPWVSMGWGYLDGSRVEAAVDALTGEGELPSKSEEAEAWMAEHQRLREDYWRNR